MLLLASPECSALVKVSTCPCCSNSGEIFNPRKVKKDKRKKRKREGKRLYCVAAKSIKHVRYISSDAIKEFRAVCWLSIWFCKNFRKNKNSRRFVKGEVPTVDLPISLWRCRRKISIKLHFPRGNEIFCLYIFREWSEFFICAFRRNLLMNFLNQNSFALRVSLSSSTLAM